MTVRIPFLLVVLLLPSRHWLLADGPPVRQQIFSISPETTRITQPLDEQGFVDYVAAVDQAARQGVTPETNYEVIVREVLGPIHEGEKQVEYFRQLGIKPPPADGDYYVGYPEFAGVLTLSDEHSRLMDEPWTTEEYPKAAEWIKLMENHLDRLVKGSKRSEYYTPYTVLIDPPEGKEESPLLKVSLESVQELREIAPGLKLRAMQRVGNGDLEGAWDDLQAIRRMSRHLAGGWTSIESLVACELDSIAFDGERHVLQSSTLTTDQGRRFLADLKDLPPLPPLAEIWDWGERFIILDALQHSVRLDPETEGVPIDWDLAFKTVNRWCDRRVAVSREKDFVTQKQMFEELEGDLARLKAKYESEQWKAELAAQDKVAQVLGRRMGEVMSYLMFPAFTKVESAQDRAHARMDLIRLGFAAEIFHRENDRFPKTLSELVPDYLEEIPLDPISGNGFIYRPSGKGALIYSVGRNARDDQGQASADESNASQGPDDIAVAVGEAQLPQPADEGSKKSTTKLLVFGAVLLFGMIALVGLISFMRARKKATPHLL